ncbi:CAP domain-containing protein [Saccharothrix syringae]|uniref:CAP domain-containing protein n=1 Tax=Saccharothrix syringae TaxID=103733 RepID=UPI000527DB98|nr:CAP domain-containing protein [Saccharothrix syringae]
MIGGLVGLLLGAAGATGVAFASPEQLAPFVGNSAAQSAGPDNNNTGVGGVGGIGEPARTDEPVVVVPTTTGTTTTGTTTTTTPTTTTTGATTTTTTGATTTTAPSTSSVAPTTTPPVQATPAEEVVALVNEARDLAGCKPLTVDERVVEAAQGHSTDMAERDYFSHTTPDGVDFAQRMRTAGYPSPGGENIAKGQRSAEQVMRAWMNSDGHRRNILNCGFTTIGVGLDTRGWYWTQNFGW